MKNKRSFQLGKWPKQLCSFTTCISVMAITQSTLSVSLICLNAWLMHQAHARKMTARDLNAEADKPAEPAYRQAVDWESHVHRSWGWNPEPAMTCQSKCSGHLCWNGRDVLQMRSLSHAEALVLACECPEGSEWWGSISAVSWSVLWRCNYIKVSNRLVDPFPSQGKALFIWRSWSYHLIDTQ